jgi:hypothetical protein
LLSTQGGHFFRHHIEDTFNALAGVPGVGALVAEELTQLGPSRRGEERARCQGWAITVIACKTEGAKK